MTASAPHITSQDNPRFRALVKLQHSSRERRKAGLSILDGIHLVEAYLQHAGRPVEVVVSRSGLADLEIAGLLARIGSEATVLSDGLFREVSSLTTPTGLIAVVKTPSPPALPAEPGPCVMLEDIQDPGNLGSILRTAAASGIGEIYLSPGSVHAWSPRVLRAGMGAHFSLRIHERVDLTAFAGTYPGKLLAAAREGGVPVYEADLEGPVGFIFGNEGGGLTSSLRNAAHQTICIPMPGATESLNVAAAAAVCLFERVRQMSVSGKQ